MTHTAEAAAVTAYDRIGGMAAVRGFVDRFYDLMETDPAYAELRALHAADLAPIRESLAGFLAAWLGGPGDWFADHPGVCMMSAHARVAVSGETARQWTEAMARALADCGIEPALRARMNAAFLQTAEAMAASRGG
jgi:hemoglobin